MARTRLFFRKYGVAAIYLCRFMGPVRGFVPLIAGVTDLLQRTLGKNPATTVVTIDEVDVDNWGIGGLPVLDYRAQAAGKARP